MRNKTAHAKLLSLLLVIVMAMSTAMVFAEGEESAPGSVDNGTVTEESADEVNDEATETEEPATQDENEENGEEKEALAFIDTPSDDSVKVGETTTLKAKANNSDAKLSWSSSDNTVATVDSSGTVKGVKAGTATITVVAATEEENVTASCKVTVTAVAPTTPTNVKAATRYGNGDNGLTISWSSDGANTDHFEVLWGTSANVNAMKPITGFSNVAANKRSIYYLETKGSYYYAVRAVGSDGTKVVSAASGKVTISGNILTNIQELVWYGHTKKKVTIYKGANLKGAVATIPKGTYVQAIGKSPAKVKKFKQPSKVQVRVKVGGKYVTGWLKYNQLKGGVKAATTVSQDYTRSVLEDFVNSYGYSSPTKYLIWVSPRTQRAYLFTGKKGNWNLSKRFRVTTGRFSHKTAPYHSAISKKKAKVFMVTEKGKRYYYKTASYFASGVSFHTGTWWANGKVRGVINKKGVPQTFGCLRMANGDAGWIYKNVPLKTTVIVKKDAV